MSSENTNVWHMMSGHVNMSQRFADRSQRNNCFLNSAIQVGESFLLLTLPLCFPSPPPLHPFPWSSFPPFLLPPSLSFISIPLLLSPSPSLLPPSSFPLLSLSLPPSSPLPSLLSPLLSSPLPYLPSPSFPSLLSPLSLSPLPPLTVTWVSGVENSGSSSECCGSELGLAKRTVINCRKLILWLLMKQLKLFGWWHVVTTIDSKRWRVYGIFIHV